MQAPAFKSPGEMTERKELHHPLNGRPHRKRVRNVNGQFVVHAEAEIFESLKGPSTEQRKQNKPTWTRDSIAPHTNPNGWR